MPCARNTVCSKLCQSFDLVEKAILVIHLGAMGSVVRSTALLRKIKSENPRSYIVWVTERPSDQILKYHPAIDRVLDFNFETLMALKAFKFETVFALDKDVKTAGLLTTLTYKNLKGFVANPINGSIAAADTDADELWQLGLSNQKKFFGNTKSEIQLLFETCGFEFQSEKYWLHLTPTEQFESKNRRQQWLGDRKILIGINTGCGNVITYKKMSMESQILLIEKIHKLMPEARVVLLGGKDETNINNEIALVQPQIVLSNTLGGVRDGLQSIAAVDILISGDSFAMHAGIALDRYTLAWFGPTCAHEVEFYGNGAAIESDFGCSPCWKRDCSKQTMCYDYVDTDQFIARLLNWQKTNEPRNVTNHDGHQL